MAESKKKARGSSRSTGVVGSKLDFAVTDQSSYILPEANWLASIAAAQDSRPEKLLPGLLVTGGSVNTALEKLEFKQLRLLRLIYLRDLGREMIPRPILTSIGCFKHLHHLNLSQSPSFETLLDSVGDLYYLELLILTDCRSLIMLPQSIVKLINLQYLYIEGTGLVQMPEEMGRLKRLKILTNFIVGNGGSNIKQLGTLLDLRGSLSVSGLENVSSALDASDANLKAKSYLHTLQLEWGSNNNNPANQSAVLENLEPSKGLEILTIGFYGGKKFPSWLGDSSFSNIVFLRLRNCYNCLSLPPLGQLPSLVHLIIERMRRLTSIGHEFYRVEASFCKPFQSLKILEFKSMSQWEEWISLEDEEFPCLEELYIANCPNFKGSLPKTLPSLAKLKISKCYRLKSILPRTSDTCNIELYKCGEVHLRSNDDNPKRNDGEVASQLPPSTSEILVLPRDGPSYSSSSPSVALRVSSMKKLLQLPSRLLSLRIERCDALESLPTGILDRPYLEHLYIIDCDSLKTFPQVHQPSSLKRLYIRNCRNFQFPQPNEMANHYILLEHLCLGSSCDSLMTFFLNCFPKLKILSLWDLRSLEYLSIENRLQNDLKSLEALEIRDCPNLTTFPEEGLLAPSLTSLILSNCNNLKSMPRQMLGLKSLQTLHINKCLKLEPPPIWSLPTSLNILCISFCDKMTPRRAWQLDKLDSLCHFEIEGRCLEMLSFPENGLLPTNLNSLRISRLLNLESLDEIGLQHLTLLQTLEINCCDKLRSLPEDGLPSSLLFLSITGCLSLNPKLQKRKAKEWFKIAHIPSIHLGEEDLIGNSQCLEAEQVKSSRQIPKEVTAMAENEAEKCKSAEEVIGSFTQEGWKGKSAGHFLQEDLICKSQCLEAEQVKSSRQIPKEVTAMAENEAEKCKSAEEVIGSFTQEGWKGKSAGHFLQEDLICKSQCLEAEQVKSSRQIPKEITAMAENEAEKCKSAEEVIGSFTQEELICKSQCLEAEQVKSSRQIPKEITAMAENEAEKCKSAEEVIGSFTQKDEWVEGKVKKKNSIRHLDKQKMVPENASTLRGRVKLQMKNMFTRKIEKTNEWFECEVRKKNSIRHLLGQTIKGAGKCINITRTS
ncbi:putative disease resistance protein At3g14460 isoform X2 [Durio zibethinus]|uniref:Disease resistance protein At3g14460 isoform X2 n=1 Tax=Durio zibethinus TaxID=66656 RepID=A0A6P6AIV9_DURZI|nr:putative disease resistance protein At3g14460 isoform X2 [Durio zibethinus]